MTVDYTLITWPAANGVRVGLGFPNATTERVSYGANTAVDFPGRPREIYGADNGLGTTPFVATSDFSGSLEVTSTGDVYTDAHRSSAADSWHPVLNYQGSSADVQASLGIWSHDYAFGHQQVEVGFGNFSLEEVNAVPEPATLALLGAGGLTMFGYGWLSRRRKLQQ
jgi:hypothetical protein